MRKPTEDQLSILRLAEQGVRLQADAMVKRMIARGWMQPVAIGAVITDAGRAVVREHAR